MDGTDVGGVGGDAGVVAQGFAHAAHHGGVGGQIDPGVYQRPLPGRAVGLGIGVVFHDNADLTQVGRVGGGFGRSRFLRRGVGILCACGKDRAGKHPKNQNQHQQEADQFFLHFGFSSFLFSEFCQKCIEERTFSAKKPQQGAPTLLRPIFRTEKSRSSYHAKPAEHTPSEQVSWLVHHGYFPGLLRAERSNDRLSPKRKIPPHLQWRYRRGFPPRSLFSHRAFTAPMGTQTLSDCLYFTITGLSCQ